MYADILQGSEDWFSIRAGKVTSSRVKDVLAGAKGADTYRAQLIAERLTGECQESGFENRAMRRGSEQEPFARAAYEVMRGVDVESVAFVDHPEIANAGASPDGYVGEDGGVEIKCPNTSTHIKWMLAGTVPSEHVPQMMWLMACSGRAWWDFVSYDARIPNPSRRLFVRRLLRDDETIAKMEKTVRAFISDVDRMTAEILEEPEE